MTSESAPVPAPAAQVDWNAVAQALQTWSTGQQDAAIAQVQPLADAGAPGVQAVLAWMLHQLGEPRWREAIPYAEAAVNAGYASAAAYVVGNMLNDPALRAQGLSMARTAAAAGVVVVDPIGQAMAMAQQGNPEAVSELLSTSWPGTNALAGDHWTSLLQTAEGAITRVQGILEELASKRAETIDRSDMVIKAAEDSEKRVREQTTQLLELVTATTNAQAASFFEGEATTSGDQANKTWLIGMGVVSFAAFLGILPLAAHYLALIFSIGSPLPKGQALSAHVTATLALATVAGVLLTRSRVRDRNRQRNKDLSVALRTMFAYGTQIEEPGERQKFIHDMGKTVIEAYLSHDSGAEENLRGVFSLLSNRP